METPNPKVMEHVLYKPGNYLVEITGHGRALCDDGDEGFWLEVLPLGIVRFPGDMAIIEECKQRRKICAFQELVDPSLGDKHRFTAAEVECDVRYWCLDPDYFGTRNQNDPNSMVGLQLVMLCEHYEVDGEINERFIIQTAKRPPEAQAIIDYYRKARRARHARRSHN